ncbi:MAG: MoaD/ThiS family protein [Clostridia bacterium]|nr:MoaD/ThiS family protein [Clostridia bacterium]
MERIKIVVTLAGSLNKYFQGEKVRAISMPAKAVAGDLLQQLSLPRESISFVAVNGVKASLEQALQEGDKVKVYPPVSGG